MTEPLAVARAPLAADPSDLHQRDHTINENPRNVSFKIKHQDETERGTRTTIFTNIASVSVQSLEAAAKKKCLDSYFNVRVEPPEVHIQEYDLGTKVTETISIKNYSSTVRRLVLKPLRSKHFKVAKDVLLKDLVIAPGLSTDVTIEVHVKPSKNDTKESVFSDVLEVAVKEAHKPDFIIKVPLKVSPAGPKLVFEKSVDFGIMVVGTGISDTDAPDSIAQKFISIRNSGIKGTTVSLEYNRSILRVFPEKFMLGPVTSCRKEDVQYEEEDCPVRIEFLRCPIGKYKECIKVKTISQSVFESTQEYPPVVVSAAVVDHKLHLKNADNSAILDPQCLDFGVIYFSQIAQFRAKLENRGLTKLHWVITHAGESVPAVPDQILATIAKKPEKVVLSTNLKELLREEIIHHDSESKASMTVFPLEGTLEPNECSDIIFSFAPKVSVAETGFKSKAPEPPVTSYRVPMQLQILRRDDTDISQEGEDPIDLLLIGKACPVQTKLSAKDVTFPPIQDSPNKSESRQTDITLKNESSLLGISFSFQSLAQFHAFPEQGSLNPGDAINIKILFKPNQLGKFEKLMEILISSLDKMPKQNQFFGVPSRKPSVYFVENSKSTVATANFPIQKLKLRLRGALKPSLPVCPPAAEGSSGVQLWRSDIQVNTKKVNNDWEDKTINRNKYLSYLRSSRMDRLVYKRLNHIGNDGVKVSMFTMESENPKLDRDNGLLPPEPTNFSGLLLPNSKIALAEDNQRIKLLLTSLMEPKIFEVQSIKNSSVRILESHLAPEELCNVFTARTCIDFGTVTVHSQNIQPINFLNLTPSQSQIQISIQSTCEGVEITPTHLVLDPLEVSGFTATFKSNKVGNLNGKITYLVNGRYKYQIFAKAIVQPPQLELSAKSVFIEIAAGHTTEQMDTTFMDVSGQHAEVMHQAYETIQISNYGNFPASFEWTLDAAQNFTSSGIAIDGEFSVEPMSGIIQSNSIAEIKVLYTAGIRSTCEKVLTMNVIDIETDTVCSQIRLPCRGEIPSATCVLLTSTKQGPLDLGICTLGYGKYDRKNPLNALASQLLIPADSVTSSLGFTGRDVPARGYQTIKIKNTSSKSCFYSAHILSNSSDVVLAAPTGIIQGNGGITELHLIVTPTTSGLFEDELHICIIGGGKVLKVPFKYEGRTPSVSLRTKNFNELSIGTILGTSTTAEIEFYNDSDIGSRAVIDFRRLPEFTFFVLSNSSIITQSTRTNSPSTKRPKSGLSLNSAITYSASLKVFGPGDEIYKFDAIPGKRLSVVKKRRGSISSETKPDQSFGKLYVFDIHPFESVSCSVVFSPTSEKVFNMQLPIFVLGSDLGCDIFIKAYGVKSPILLSKNSVNFKNKVVVKDTGIVGVSLLKSTSKETITITNNSDKQIIWSFDVEPLEEVDNVFKVEPFHGNLKSGGTQQITVSFHPESIGSFHSKIPLHIDFMGRQAPFSLEMFGTGVEPSIAFDPPEVFLPISPPGQESVSTFSIVNYGCERTEVKCQTFTDTISRHGQLEVQFPEGKLLKNDGEKLPVVVRFISNPTIVPSSIALSSGGSKYFLSSSKPLITQSTHLSQDKLIESNRAPKSVDFPRKTLSLAANEISSSLEIELKGNAKKASKPNLIPDSLSVENSLTPLYGVPISFTTKLEFSDSTRTFFLPIHGTFDSSLLTIQGYVASHSQHCLKIREQLGHIFFEPKIEEVKRADPRKRARMMMIHKPFKSPGGIVLEGVAMHAIVENLDKIAVTLTKWIAEHVGSHPAMEFPLQFCKFHGKMLLDLIQSISSKKRLTGSVFHSSSATLSGPERVKALYQLYHEALSTLTSQGALLSSVKPEFLMSLEDFRLFIGTQKDLMQSENCGASVHDEYVEYHRRIETYFAIISKEAWITVISQIIKVYALQIVTPKHFRGLAGVSSDESQLTWPITSKGNIYSTSEVVLLRWASYHMWKRNGIIKRLTNFTDDFKSCSPFAYLFLSHLPELEESHFEHFHFTCTSRDQQETNIKIINTVLKDVFRSSNFSLPSDQVVNGENPLEIMLLLLFLYQTLPHFITEGTISFHGALHETVIQTIEITNPSSRTLTYSASLTGANEFSLSDSVLNLSGRGQCKLEISFTSRFSRSSSGRLKLMSKRMGLNNASILIYDLNATVNQPVPKKVYTMNAQMYCSPPVQIGVEVVNPFDTKGVFEVTLHLSRVYGPLLVSHRGQSDSLLPYIEAAETEKINPPAYRTTVKSITLDGFQSSTIPVTFQPFEPGHHKCTIHLIDENVGEFQYQIDGDAKAPAAVELLWTCKAQNTLEKAIRVQPVNTARDKALHVVLMDETTRLRMSKSRPKDTSAFVDRDKYQLPKQSLRYKVDYLSPYFKGPPELLLKQSMYSQRERKMHFNVEQNYTELHVVFCPHAPGKYSCKVVLTCMDVPDVRVFKIHGVAISEGTKADLELQTPARQPLLQEIPIVNKTEDDWSIKATIEGQQFVGPSNIIAKARQTTFYGLEFCPVKAGEVNGVLTLANAQTSQKYVYTLRGIGQEPLPEETREIECIARETVTETFEIFNHTDQDVDYDILTDLPNSSTTPSVTVPANSCVKHSIQFRSINVGSQMQIVTFVNRQNQSYIWFIIRLKVLPSPAIEVISLSTYVRTAIAAEIMIVNPNPKKMIYTVNAIGEGLIGSKEIAIDANSEAPYSLTFAPLLCQTSTGSLVFHNEEVGEFWYELKLDAMEAPPVNVSEMSAPLGKCAHQSVFIENPINSEATIHLSLTNTQDFQIMLNLPALPSRTQNQHRQRKVHASLQITMKPLERVEVYVLFWPSSLTEPSIAVLNVVSKQIGNFAFNLKGHGLMPEPMADVTVRSLLRKSTTSVISFVNPLVDPIPVTVKIIEEEKLEGGKGLNESEFTLMLSRKPKHHVAGLDTLDIPFTYTPQRMIGRAATILVEMGQLHWIYPIMGLPDAPVPAIPKYYESRAKETLLVIYEVTLNEFNFDVEEITSRTVEDWNKMLDCDVEVVSVHQITKEAVKMGLKFKLLDVRDLQDDGLALKFEISYTPTKAGHANILFSIHQIATGGRWRFPIGFISLPPLVDDVIVIEGAINKLTAVSFKLKNSADHARKFRAFFTAPIAPEFSVAPTEGMLWPENVKGSGDNLFVVGYKASSYGKPLIGTLVIECDDVSWSYEVRGTTPQNTRIASEERRKSVLLPPLAEPNKETKPSKSKKNFLKENANIFKTKGI